MSPVTEVLTLRLPAGQDTGPNSKFRESFLHAMQPVLAREGCGGGSWGTQVEDPSILWAFFNWDALDYHLDFQKDPSYKPITKQIIGLTEGRLGVFHFAPSSFPPLPALTAPTSPVTELWHIYFDENVSQANKDKFEISLKQFLEAIKRTGTTAVTGGWSVETVPIVGQEGEDVLFYLCCIGWESVDKHVAAKASNVFKSSKHLIHGHEGQKASMLVHYSGINFAHNA